MHMYITEIPRVQKSHLHRKTLQLYSSLAKRMWLVQVGTLVLMKPILAEWYQKQSTNLFLLRYPGKKRSNIPRFIVFAYDNLALCFEDSKYYIYIIKLITWSIYIYNACYMYLCVVDTWQIYIYVCINKIYCIYMLNIQYVLYLYLLNICHV